MEIHFQWRRMEKSWEKMGRVDSRLLQSLFTFSSSDLTESSHPHKNVYI